MSKKAALTCFALMLALASTAAAAPLSIGILAADDPSWITDVTGKLVATGGFSDITVIDVGSTTPTLTDLQAFQSILVWSDSGFADRNTLGDNIDAYLRAGGNVVLAVFAIADPGAVDLGGAFASNDDYAIEPADQSQGTALTLGTIHVPGSPLLQGVTSFDGGSLSFYSPGALNPAATDIADWSNGAPLVATRTIGSGTTVNLNFFPPSSDLVSGFWVSSTDGSRLMANALGSRGSAAVPEPSALTLAGLGIAALAIRRSLRRS